MGLEFFVSHRNNIAVVSLAGSMDLQAIGKVDECRVQVEGLQIKHLVINMAEVNKITEDALRPFAMLQSFARRCNISMRICGLSEELTEYLMVKGAIRQNELRGDLLDSLKSLDLKVTA